jgi:hypothetical protein
MRVIGTKKNAVSDNERRKQLDELQENAVRTIRENTSKMKKKIEEATLKFQLPAANA